jgi:hypothetical protein
MKVALSFHVGLVSNHQQFHCYFQDQSNKLLLLLHVLFIREESVICFYTILNNLSRVRSH